MNFFEIITGLLSALFAITGIYAIGSLAGRYISTTRFKSHFNVGLGFGVYQILFILLSLFQNAIFTNIASLFLLTISMIFARREIALLYKSIIKLFKKDYLVLFVLFVVFLPFLSRLMSPPTSADGLSFYLPSVEWLYNYGLVFNPYLPRYTAMPQGTEYFYTLSYGIGGFSGVRWTDALFTLLLIHLIYSFCRGLMSLVFARLTTILCLLIPGTFFFVFGTGKVDTIGVYIVMMGFAFLITNWKIKQLNSIIVLFSISLGVKYTNWPLIVLPLTFLIFYQLIKQFSFKSIIIAFIPFLFIGPVLIKNKININNPLAPLIYNANQSRYVKSHGSLPESVLNKKVIKKLPGFDKFKISKKLKYGTLFFLGLSICWIIFRFFPKSALPEAWLWALYLILSLFPWFYSLGFSNQPLRFIWAPIMLTIIASNVLIETFTRNKTKFNTHLSKGLLAISIITLISVGYIKHGNRIQYFLNSQTMSLESWYSLVGKDHYGFSLKIKDLNIKYSLKLGQLIKF